MKEISIGLIGVGKMGRGIGYNLLKNGYKIFLLNGHSIDNIMELKMQGACIVNDIDELCKNTSVVILCLPSSEEVESVCMIKGGLLQKIKKGSLILDCTTAWPESTISLSRKFNKKSVIFIDSPLTRTPIEAMDGRLNCILGCRKNQYKQIEAVLASFCENVFFAGSIGKANQIKILNNGITLCVTAIVALIMQESRDLKIDPYILRQILSSGGANNAQFQGMMNWLIDGNKEALKFSLGNATKDLNYLKKMSKKNMHMVDQILEMYKEAIEEFGSNATLPYLTGYNPGDFKKYEKK